MTVQGDAVRELLAGRVTELEDNWADLRDRLQAAAQVLEALAVRDRNSGMTLSSLRLFGKVEGVKLALSYMKGADRG